MKKDPMATTVTITPEMAQKWLDEANLNNRKVRVTAVARYARDMKNGRWRPGAANISFSPDGLLLDGQHRLLACLEAGIPFDNLVAHDVPAVAQEVMDTGIKRSFADLLARHGESSTIVLASAIRQGFRWQTGQVFGPASGTFSFSEGLDWYQHNPSIRRAISPAQRIRGSFSSPTPIVTALIHRIRLIDEAEASTFVEDLVVGANLQEGHPILALRSWLLNARLGTKPRSEFYLAIFIKAWNAYVSGEDAKLFSFKRYGRNKEDLPVLLDLDGNKVRLVNELDYPVPLPVQFDEDDKPIA